MNRRTCLLAILCIVCAVPATAEWELADARWRPDHNPFAQKQVWDGWIWSEGWSHQEQFYPKHFEPAGSIHVILRNDSDSADTIILTHIDGVAIEEVVTTPKRASRVIWHRVERPKLGAPETGIRRDDPRWQRAMPQEVLPGQWVECSLRLRSVPKGPVRLRFRSRAQGHVEVTVPIEPPRVRLESISFSSQIDRVFIYIRSLEGKRVPKGSVRLDGRDVDARCTWTEGPSSSGLSLAEVALEPRWEYGSHHLIEVNLPGGTRLVQPVRAWDGFFVVGLFGPTQPARLKDAIAHGINTYFWAEPKSLDEYELNNIPWHDIGYHRPRTREQTGVLFNYNYDEPDCHDVSLGSDLPWMQRLGVYAQSIVLPRIRYQRAREPRTPNLVLVDNTYKPLGWYVYGQTPDIFATDPYVPLNADQLGYVLHALETARDACTPRPVVAVLWATGFVFEEDRQPPKPPLPPQGGDMKLRPPSPEEERIMVFYSVGCGAKGVGYFCDFSSSKEDGKWVGLSENKPLWEEVGRTNRDVLALAPYLSIGCPLPCGQETERVWARALMCGREHMVVIVVNKGHHIGYNTRFTYAWHTPAKDVEVALPLPTHFRQCRVQEVRDGVLVPASAVVERGQVRLHLDEVDTARAFLISAEGH